MGLFVNILVNQSSFSTSADRNKVANTCPVDIFSVETEVLVIRPEMEDECTFCYLCIQNSPPGSIRVQKTYQKWLENEGL